MEKDDHAANGGREASGLGSFWRAHLEGWRGCDLNQREYCELHGPALKRFGNWRAKYQHEDDVPGQKLLWRRDGGLIANCADRDSWPMLIGVGKGRGPPRPPNRTCGFPAYGSPVGGFLIGNVSRHATPGKARTARHPRRRCSSSFDAVGQRRHHALRPHRSFHPSRTLDPGPVAGFCAPFSLFGTVGALLLPCGHRASTFLPPFPRPGFAPRASRGQRRCGTMRALTPAGLATGRQVSPLTPLCLPSIPLPNTSCPPNVAFTVTSARPAGPLPGTRLRLVSAGSPRHTAESGSSSCGLLVRLRLLPTPPLGDAVTFGFMRCDVTWQRLPPC